MADKKRKIADSFRNSSYENKLSKVVKLIAEWVIKDIFKDVLKLEKNDKLFLCNDIPVETSLKP